MGLKRFCCDFCQSVLPMFSSESFIVSDLHLRMHWAVYPPPQLGPTTVVSHPKILLCFSQFILVLIPCYIDYFSFMVSPNIGRIYLLHFFSVCLECSWFFALIYIYIYIYTHIHIHTKNLDSTWDCTELREHFAFSVNSGSLKKITHFDCAGSPLLLTGFHSL